jgi:hypothetical protein
MNSKHGHAEKGGCEGQAGMGEMGERESYTYMFTLE